MLGTSQCISWSHRSWFCARTTAALSGHAFITFRESMLTNCLHKQFQGELGWLIHPTWRSQREHCCGRWPVSLSWTVCLSCLLAYLPVLTAGLPLFCLLACPPVLSDTSRALSSWTCLPLGESSERLPSGVLGGALKHDDFWRFLLAEERTDCRRTEPQARGLRPLPLGQWGCVAGTECPQGES